MMIYSTLRDSNWIHRVTQDIIFLVLRTNKDLRGVSWIFLPVLWGPPFRAHPSKVAKFLQWNDYRASNQPRMIVYFAPPPRSWLLERPSNSSSLFTPSATPFLFRLFQLEASSTRLGRSVGRSLFSSFAVKFSSLHHPATKTNSWWRCCRGVAANDDYYY
jgi:hypothetical protein